MDNNALWYIDGRWMHPNEATISINDVAVLRGYSAFESLRTYDRRPFHLHDHLERLYHSASLIELDVPYARKFVVDVVDGVIERNPYRHASIRILVTGGESEDGVMPMGRPVLAVLITPGVGVLMGVTRRVVLELAEGRFPVEERPILLNELSLVDEAFITSSSREITPVIQIDDMVIADGKPGPRTYELEQRFIAMVERGEF